VAARFDPAGAVFSVDVFLGAAVGGRFVSALDAPVRRRVAGFGWRFGS